MLDIISELDDSVVVFLFVTIIYLGRKRIKLLVITACDCARKCFRGLRETLSFEYTAEEERELVALHCTELCSLIAMADGDYSLEEQNMIKVRLDEVFPNDSIGGERDG